MSVSTRREIDRLERYHALTRRTIETTPERCFGCLRAGTIERASGVVIVSDDYKVPLWRCRACGFEFGREEGER
ncbi:MAG: hypothetical protein MSG64_19870 [Pyrinomonadaceae bacterium MAG19_C2-C3]|nr:hypothetical protein [Pyrinomonadaceae bacterium MAG19_C2-C3]